ncbi:MAG: GTP 3',8-cyclase MoaA [Candidatus Eiseniibacteriota bacterium]|nr:MAG: GTP 3',8-cyclase MoaA [Candidatus Eisenbacteria bacterium]
MSQTRGNSRPAYQLRISVTDRCDLHCIYCVPEDGIEWCSREEILRFEDIFLIVREFVSQLQVRGVRLTGGEPLCRAGISSLIELVRTLELDEITMTTNGYKLAREAQRLREAGLSRVNVSLDTLDSETYRRLTRGGELSRTIEGIRAAKACGLEPVKINMLVLRGWNEEEIPRMAEFAQKEGVHVRFLEAIAIGETSLQHHSLWVPADEILERLRRTFGVSVGQRAPGETETRLILTPKDGPQFEAGLITSESDPFCGTCSRLRLSARGRLRGCLLNEAEVDLFSWVKDPGRTTSDFLERVSRAVSQKPPRRRTRSPVRMAEIGG